MPQRPFWAGDPRGVDPGAATGAQLPPPARVRILARGAGLVPLWRNEIGGVTFRTDDDRVIKFGPRNAETSFRDEAARLRWASAYTSVPRVLELGGDATQEWMVTVALPGLSAVTPRWLADPATAVAAVGAGLRAFHDALPVRLCPFVWDVPARIANAAMRGIRVPDALHHPPPVDRLVVCHGDACCPNTLVGDDGRWTAHVDLGALGVGDRWADIAVAAMSTVWNYGPGWEDALIEAYGVAPDPTRLAYYRELWDAT
ncbi:MULTISPECIES: aminoglycoside 3'-phosphotransferase [unclassified Microbacterium]|uniref:aminoglycoside 3'-phosphotransferase n=1 Tax=unclassified Microbacterium TaxID=2609290 RepID=UPI00214C4F36|nr:MULTISPECIES: aminoglycoside 3'-phosphotransferase [unclassified Microbacterium]MCR2808675.1 aminoglycoside 3'-phosphotransferase [Microbacterium sp. zg.B185]WIM18893.1 aminoglycoside 3'-phosphotransferase [Microbacterium sp. zg-B185]